MLEYKYVLIYLSRYMQKNVLGLDLGIGSLGWAVLDAGTKQIVGSGIRKFFFCNFPQNKICSHRCINTHNIKANLSCFVYITFLIMMFISTSINLNIHFNVTTIALNMQCAPEIHQILLKT